MSRTSCPTATPITVLAPGVVALPGRTVVVVHHTDRDGVAFQFGGWNSVRPRHCGGFGASSTVSDAGDAGGGFSTGMGSVGGVGSWRRRTRAAGRCRWAACSPVPGADRRSSVPPRKNDGATRL